MPLSHATGPRHGRRAARGSPSVTPNEEFSSSQEQANTVFKLQLRPLEDPDGFKPSVQLVAREFANRYLESVGVRPSRATLDLVHRNVALGEEHIRATLRAKGHVEDEIHITVPPVNHTFKVPVFVNPAAVLQLGIGNEVLAAEGAAAAQGQGQVPEEGGAAGIGGHPEEQGPGRGSSSSITAADGSPSAGSGGSRSSGPDFLELASRYLHPFNLDLSLAKKNVAALYAAARHRKSDSSDDEGQGRQGGREGRAGGRGADGPASTSGRGGQGQGREERSVSSGRLGLRGSIGGPERGHGCSSTGSTRTCTPQMGRGGAPSVSAYQWGPFGPGSGEQGGGLDRQWEVLEELAQPLIVTPEVVLTLQSQLEAALTQWHRNTAPEALKGRLTAAEFTATLEELSSEATVKLLVTLINFMHEEFVRGHPNFPEFLEARLMSREGLRSQHSRRQEQLLEDRGLTSSSTGEGLGLTGPGGIMRQRSMSRSAGQQASIRTQQMTSLQKYDLGYQAYVKKKLEGGSRQGTGAQPPPLTARSGVSRAGTTTARSHVTIARGAGGGAGGRGISPWDSPDGMEGARVSFAVAPHYHDHDSDTDPGSPAYRSVFSGTTARSAASCTTARSAASGGSLWGGPLNLPGAGSARSVASETHSQVPDLPPRVGNALKHSASFKMASAATTARAIHSSLGDSDLAALQSERLFALHVDFATRFKALRQSRSGMFFTLPILLLSMRLCINTLFSTLYPLWTRLPEGAEVLDHMDESITALFDPHGYLERALSLLQSTPTAIQAVTRHPQRRGTERQHFNDTSPLLQATMQGAKSAGARKLLKSSANQPQGRSLLRTQLTAAQRAALFQRGLQWMQQPDPMLSQIGEPQAVGR